MKNSELIKILQSLPADAEIYREADHGQTPESSPTIFVTSRENLDYYQEEGWEDLDSIKNDSVTGVLIG